MSFNLPYYRESYLLPGPLPEQHEIEQATKILPTTHSPASGDRIVVVRDLYVVKYGPTVSENEGHVLRYIEQDLSVPAPRLHAMYQKGTKLYLVMDYIPGVTLGEVWNTLSDTSKTFLLAQLRAVFECMRAIPVPGFYGSVTQGPVPHSFFLPPIEDPDISGPFDEEVDFSRAIALRANQMCNDGGATWWPCEFLLRNLPEALQCHQPVFTHGDLQRENIILTKVINTSSGTEEYQVIAVVDWESAGWYPNYWEYACIFPGFKWNDDWPTSVEKIIDALPLEGTLMAFVHEHFGF
ncbi:kinase-like protein [Aspergillus sclerotioniger CBS 115572]|uniref:Kinase-like protein n=1 Tax=Aspergillus sclerotioniger CBS 115572 TaxID=1450535 RepID=A0A317WRL2_9EURO|nr:kinase-like protein [Aspergillus sclerotioniger CBS 115572]PWY87942.1 kinase-like protein [Aspergillus sclerotioniger CBS 115572]